MCEVKIKTEFDNEDTSLDPLEKNIIRERYEFYQRCQKSEETFYTFLENIRSLAESCEFHREEKEFLIRDRFLCGLNNRSLQLNLLATGGNPTVDDVLHFCCEQFKESNADIKLEQLIVLDKENYSSVNTGSGSIVENNGVCSNTTSVERKPDELGLNDDGDNTQWEGSNEENDEDEQPKIDVAEAPQQQPPRKKRAPIQKNYFDYKCSVCEKDFIDLRYFKGHLVEHSIQKFINYKDRGESSQQQTPKKLRCYFCKKVFDDYDRLIIHFSAHVRGNKDLPKVNCKLCGKESTAGYLRKHMFQHIEGSQLNCNFCEKSFPTHVQLNRHKKIHEEFQHLVCDICGKEFLRKLYLQVHKKKMHPEQNSQITALECFMCRKEFKSLPALRAHVHWHALPKNHLCTICGERFRAYVGLKRHLMRPDHNGENAKKFQCLICYKRFYDKTQFVNHRVVHTKERPYVCTYENCSKRYSTRKSLKEHYHLHTGQKPYQCPLCDYKGAVKMYLNRHMLTHTGRQK